MNEFKVVSSGNLAVVEYPKGCNSPEFTLDKNGLLFVFGYKMPFAGQEISVAKQVDTKLIDYEIVGNYEEAIVKVGGDWSELIIKGEIDILNCVVLCNPNI